MISQSKIKLVLKTDFCRKIHYQWVEHSSSAGGTVDDFYLVCWPLMILLVRSSYLGPKREPAGPYLGWPDIISRVVFTRYQSYDAVFGRLTRFTEWEKLHHGIFSLYLSLFKNISNICHANTPGLVEWITIGSPTCRLTGDLHFSHSTGYIKKGLWPCRC